VRKPTASDRIDLRSLVADELDALMAELGLPRYRASQIFRWVHRFGATNPAGMGNLPRDLRTLLGEQTTLVPLEITAVQESSDGTRKFRLRCHDGPHIESVLIPREDKLTLCISSQVGCALGCQFCATATMGMRRNLTTGEIVDQVYRVQTQLEPQQRISNLVFMGMGEPMANLGRVVRAVENLCQPSGLDLSPRRITISTVGLVPGIRRLGQMMPHVGLAVSLHATTDALRNRLMPVNRRWPLSELVRTLEQYPLPRRRRITFEYILLPGLNDSAADAMRLARLLRRIPAKINLLPYNPCRPDHPELRRPNDQQLDDFAEALRAKGLTTTVRYSRGLDIAAACGQLAAT